MSGQRYVVTVWEYMESWLHDSYICAMVRTLGGGGCVRANFVRDGVGMCYSFLKRVHFYRAIGIGNQI